MDRSQPPHVNPCEVLPGDEVTLRAHASDPNGDRLTYSWDALGRGTFIGATDEDTARWRAPDRYGYFRIAVTVSDGEDTATAWVTVTVAESVSALPLPATSLLGVLLALLNWFALRRDRSRHRPASDRRIAWKPQRDG